MCTSASMWAVRSTSTACPLLTMENGTGRTRPVLLDGRHPHATKRPVGQVRITQGVCHLMSTKARAEPMTIQHNVHHSCLTMCPAGASFPSSLPRPGWPCIKIHSHNHHTFTNPSGWETWPCACICLASMNICACLRPPRDATPASQGIPPHQRGQKPCRARPRREFAWLGTRQPPIFPSINFLMVHEYPRPLDE